VYSRKKCRNGHQGVEIEKGIKGMFKIVGPESILGMKKKIEEKI
jgi:hypothetical protein